MTAFMDAAHSSATISRDDRKLAWRISVAVVLLVVLASGVSFLYRFYGNKLFDLSGRAQWIWARHQISRNTPVVFFAARDFDLPENRFFTRIKVCADPEYTLWFNGRQIASKHVSGEERFLDVYDVTALARTGRNRILVGTRSTNGVGGLLASVDIRPEVENLAPTDENWKIFRSWRDDLPQRDAGQVESPMLIGEPPAGPWGYLTTRQGRFSPPPRRVVLPRSAAPVRAQTPVIRIRGGVAIVVREAQRAVAYDFGHTSGRVHLTLVGPHGVPPTIAIRLANAPEELALLAPATTSIAFAPGETSVIDPVSRRFRYVMVFGGRAQVDVVQP